MTNNLTYSITQKTQMLPNGSCASSYSRVQLHEDNVQDRKRRCPSCGRMMQITPHRVKQGLTIGYAGVAILSEHRPHT